jgi:hypothetical protein
MREEGNMSDNKELIEYWQQCYGFLAFVDLLSKGDVAGMVTRTVAALEAADKGEPVAWLKEWTDDDAPFHRRRVDLSPDCEPWLVRHNPKITPLYAHPQPLDRKAIEDEVIERCAKVARETPHRSGVNADGRTWLEKATRDTCANAILALKGSK